MDTDTPTGGRRRTLAWVVLEAGLVVFGLVLAALVGQWQQARADARAGADARAAIRSELAENRRLLAAARDYHTGITNRLYPHMAPDAPGPDTREIFSGGFMRPAVISKVAWDNAGATGTLAHLDPGETLELARRYESLTGYRASADALGAIIYQAIYDEGIAGLSANWRGVAQLVQTLSWQECQLLASIDDLLGPPGEADDGPGAAACAAMGRQGR